MACHFPERSPFIYGALLPQRNDSGIQEGV